MNRNSFFILMIMAFVLGGCNSIPVIMQNTIEEDSYVAEINNNQPIAVGDEIYKTEFVLGYFESLGIYSWEGSRKVSETTKLVYYYLGTENNSLRIKERISQYKNDAFLGAQDTILTLPLSSDKQAFLRVKTLREKEQPKELHIVADEFYRLNVKESGS